MSSRPQPHMSTCLGPCFMSAFHSKLGLLVFVVCQICLGYTNLIFIDRSLTSNADTETIFVMYWNGEKVASVKHSGRDALEQNFNLKGNNSLGVVLIDIFSVQLCCNNYILKSMFRCVMCLMTSVRNRFWRTAFKDPSGISYYGPRLWMTTR